MVCGVHCFCLALHFLIYIELKNLASLSRFLYFLSRIDRIEKIGDEKVRYTLGEMLDFSKNYYAFQPLEQWREQFKRSKETLPAVSQGALSQIESASHRTIRSIARGGISGPWQCQAYFRLARTLAPQRILEMGTSLGLSTAYLSLACPSSDIVTVDADPGIISWAQKTFQKFQISNINLIHASFRQALKDLNGGDWKPDLVIIDGNHRLEATCRYFDEIMALTDYQAIVVIDDIHWSKEMELAWQYIIRQESTAVTVDLFQFGIIFPRVTHAGHYRLLPWFDIFTLL